MRLDIRLKVALHAEARIRFVAPFTGLCHFGHACIADRESAELLTVENGLIAQRWQLEAFFQGQLVGAWFVTNGANSSAPNLVVLKFPVELQKFPMRLEVVNLLLHVNRSGLLVNMERQFDVLIFQAFLAMIPLIVLDL